MRRVAIFTAGAALVLGSLAIPGVAVATGKTTTPQQSTTVSAQSAQLDNEITALGKGRHGKGHGKSGYRKGYRRGYRHGYSDGRFGYGRYGYGFGYGYWPVGYGYGYWPGAYGYGGFWPGGFGCNFDYPCGPPYDEQCRSFRGAPPADPKCQTQQIEPAPGQSAQPTPDAGAQPAPAPDAGTQPAPAPAPGQGDTQPRPY
jgi:hypothetical protein